MTALTTAAMPSARESSLALRRVVAVLLGLMVVVNVLYLAGLVFEGGDDRLVGVWLALAAQWIPVTIFWIVATRIGFTRLSVICAAAAVTFSAIGDTYYTLAMDGDGYLPFPSPADVPYLLFYPLMVAALVMLTRRRLAGAGRLVVLETAVASVGASAVLAVVLGPPIHDALESGTAFESAIALAYPLFDLVLIAVIVGIASVPTVRIGRRWWALITGLGIFAAGDVVYALLAADERYVAGTPLDATWSVGLAFLTWWVAGVSRTCTEPRPPSHQRLGLSLPAFAVLAGLAVLVVGTTVRLSVLAIVLAALTVGLGAVPIIFRQAILGRMLVAQEDAVRRLTELDRAKTDILVTVNHEFRTPLTSISGHVELLLDGSAGDLPEAAVGALRTIERNATRLQSLIDETFTASRLEDLESFAVRTPQSVAEVLTRAVARVDPQARKRGVALTVDGDGLSATVEADGAHLERAFANLIDNAVKFSAADAAVTIVARSSPSGDDVAIRISDTGIGIPEDDIPQLFATFFRASNVQELAIPGVGLGLAISAQIVKAHGGTIDVESAVGRGTTMTVRLPAVPAPPR